jgi:polyprenyl P-hydroxybenzoate/phenylacrylic acid decarboxylase-like protein
MEIVVAITGASGTVIGSRLLQVLDRMGEHRVHLIVSAGAELVMAQEVLGDQESGGQTPTAMGLLPATYRWQPQDMSSPLASSSRAADAMVIAPCSMKTLAAVAHGYADDLIVRAAETMLRLGRPLVLMPRETPLSLPAIENMRLAKLAGAILLPPVVAYYPQPRTVDQVTDFFVGKVLDVLGLGHDLYRRWGAGA